MAEPSWPSRTSWIVALGGAWLLAGCSVVPKSRLDECHKLSKTLEADKTRLKNQLITVQSQHADLVQRADDDARRLRVQADEITRLLSSVQAYQDDRDQLASDYAKLKDQLQVASNPLSTSLLSRFETFARGRPGCEFDPSSAVLTLASDPLFKPGTDQLRAESRSVLEAVAELLRAPDGQGLRMLVAGHTDDSGVRRTNLGGGSARDGHLSLDRAIRIRDRLALQAGIDPSRLEVAGFEASQPRSEGTDDRARARNRRIEIRLQGGPAAPTGAVGPREPAGSQDR